MEPRDGRKTLRGARVSRSSQLTHLDDDRVRGSLLLSLRLGGRVSTPPRDGSAKFVSQPDLECHGEAGSVRGGEGRRCLHPEGTISRRNVRPASAARDARAARTRVSETRSCEKDVILTRVNDAVIESARVRRTSRTKRTVTFPAGSAFPRPKWPFSHFAVHRRVRLSAALRAKRPPWTRATGNWSPCARTL